MVSTKDWKQGGCWTQPMCWHVSAFLFQISLRHTFVPCREVNGYFLQGYLTAEFVCSPGAFSAWLEDRLHCRQISGLALGLPFPPVLGQKYADESLERKKVINRGAAWMVEVCHISPAGWQPNGFIKMNSIFSHPVFSERRFITAETFLIFIIQDGVGKRRKKKQTADYTDRKNIWKTLQRHNKVSQDMGVCSATLFCFCQAEEMFVHIFRVKKADHILLLKHRVSLLLGEAAAHGSVPPLPISLLKGQHL